jgi:hypothetical protein
MKLDSFEFRDGPQSVCVNKTPAVVEVNKLKRGGFQASNGQQFAYGDKKHVAVAGLRTFVRELKNIPPVHKTPGYGPPRRKPY